MTVWAACSYRYPAACGRRVRSHSEYDVADLRHRMETPVTPGYAFFGRWAKHETLLDPDDVAAGHVMRFRRAGPERVVRSRQPAHPAIVSVEAFTEVQLLRRARAAGGLAASRKLEAVRGQPSGYMHYARTRRTCPGKTGLRTSGRLQQHPLGTLSPLITCGTPAYGVTWMIRAMISFWLASARMVARMCVSSCGSHPPIAVSTATVASCLLRRSNSGLLTNSPNTYSMMACGKRLSIGANASTSALGRYRG